MTTSTGAAWQRLAMIALLVLAVGRGGALVVADPLLGVANNYDMIRVQGCIDAYPVRAADVPPGSNSPEAPIPRYAFRDDVSPGCYWTSASLFAYAALPLMHAEAARSGDGAFSIRWVGLVGLVLTLAIGAAYAFAWQRRGREGAALLTAAVLAIVMMDPANTLYLNGFYAEYAAIFWLFVAGGAVALVLDPSRRAGVALLAWTALALVALAMSKIQHAALGVVIAAIVAVVWLIDRRVSRRAVVAVLVGGVAGLVLQVIHLRQPDMSSMARANITNTVFFAFLAQAPDPVATARRLDLPATCAQYAGKNWFTPGMQEPHACPEVFDVGRARLARLAWREPALIPRVLWEGLRRSRPWLPWLGVVAGEKWKPLPASQPSVGRVVDALPFAGYAAIVLVPWLLLAVVLVDARRRDAMPRDPSLVATLAIAALLPLPVLGTVVFGDGYADTAKQSHLVVNAMLVFWLGFIAWLVARWRHARASPPRA